MSEVSSSDVLLAELLRDMCQLIEVRKPDMSPADLENAMQWLQNVARTCGQATAYCDQMHFDDEQARSFMTSILRAMTEAVRFAILDASESNSALSVH